MASGLNRQARFDGRGDDGWHSFGAVTIEEAARQFYDRTTSRELSSPLTIQVRDEDNPAVVYDLECWVEDKIVVQNLRGGE